MDPKGTVGRIYKEKYYTMLDKNMKALGLVDLEKKIFFLCFSHCKTMGASYLFPWKPEF